MTDGDKWLLPEKLNTQAARGILAHVWHWYCPACLGHGIVVPIAKSLRRSDANRAAIRHYHNVQSRGNDTTCRDSATAIMPGFEGANF